MTFEGWREEIAAERAAQAAQAQEEERRRNLRRAGLPELLAEAVQELSSTPLERVDVWRVAFEIPGHMYRLTGEFLGRGWPLEVWTRRPENDDPGMGKFVLLEDATIVHEVGYKGPSILSRKTWFGSGRPPGFWVVATTPGNDPHVDTDDVRRAVRDALRRSV